MPEVVHGYCTRDDVRDQLGDDNGRVSPDLIDRAVGAASRAIDAYCRRRFWLDDTPTTKTYRIAERTEAVIVNDIGSTTGLVVATDSGLDGSFATTWLDTDYQLGPLNADDGFTPFAYWTIETLGSQVFTYHPRRGALRVTARHGWSAVPAEITQAAILKATALFKRKDAPFGVAGFGDFGAVRVTRADVDVLDLVDPYRIPGIA